MGCQPSRPAGGGLNSSSKFETIGDSVHVMLEHDKKVCATRGQSVCGYVPRPPHPLLLDANAASKQRPHGPAVVVEEEEEDNTKNDTNKQPHDNDNDNDDDDAEGRTVDLSQADESVGEKQTHRQGRRGAPRETSEEARRRLLWHTAHHCATVDPRDVRLVGSSRSLRRIPAAASAIVGAA
jgi:hypothetical protein